MSKYASDYSEYMQKGKTQSGAAQGGDYQKYMSQYSGDYRKYMEQSGTQAGGEQGGDYQKYMKEYSGGDYQKYMTFSSRRLSAQPQPELLSNHDVHKKQKNGKENV